ncbi:MAG: exosortase/archaeosortase family protein [Candidatus Syntropharchaeia archaeon]
MKKVLLVLLLSVLYFRTFIWLGNSWLTDPFYSHGFLVVAVSGYVAWRNIRSSETGEPFEPGILVFGFGLFLYAIGFITTFPFLSAFSFLFTASGLILYFYGKPMMRSLLFPISFLIFAIPLPFLFLEKIAFFLQSITAGCSASLIGVLGIPVERVGNKIHLRDAIFTIGLPCSGINTLVSLLTLTTIFIYILRCPLYKKGILLLLSVPVAISANILRITSLLLIANHYGAETAVSIFHTYSNLLLFILAFIILIIFASIIGCRLREAE